MVVYITPCACATRLELQRDHRLRQKSIILALYWLSIEIVRLNCNALFNSHTVTAKRGTLFRTIEE